MLEAASGRFRWAFSQLFFRRRTRPVARKLADEGVIWWWKTNLFSIDDPFRDNCNNESILLAPCGQSLSMEWLGHESFGHWMLVFLGVDRGGECVDGRGVCRDFVFG